MSEFYLHEDEWGMRDLVPEENRFRATTATAEAERFGEEHRAPGGVGWTDMYVAPEMPVSIAERKITLAALCALLPELARVDQFYSGYSSYRELLKKSFALRGDCGVIYGGFEGERVTSLHLTHASEEMAPLLLRLGRAYRLVLVDWYSDRVVDLTDERAIREWIE